MADIQFKAWTIRDLREIPSGTDPEFCGIIDEGDGYLTLTWGGGYDLALSEIKSPEDLIWTVHHLCNKRWSGMTPARIGALISIVAQHRGWQPYAKAKHKNEAPIPEKHVLAERAKMTPDLRYQVIRRDGYRCRCCGASVATGAVLHVDHIQPVSKGGPTVLANLQTLCSGCNAGKAAQ